MRKDVREVIDLCRRLGLDPVMESGSGHYKVRDPKSGTYLFGISSSPSDPNWRWMIIRHLRRLGLIRKGGTLEKSRTGRATTSEKKRMRRSAVDLVALKRAQDQAASRGERIPTLDDLDDSTEILSRRKMASGGSVYSDEAQEEAIDLMAARADAPRISYIRQRLRKLFEEKGSELEQAARARFEAEGKQYKVPAGKGSRAEFVRIALHEVAPKRNLRAWKSESSGQQGLSTLLENPKAGMQIWVADLLDATMDHIDGLKWGDIDPTRRVSTTPESQFTAPKEKAQPTPTPTPEPEEIEEIQSAVEEFNLQAQLLPVLETTTEDIIRERYAEALLEILKTEGSQTSEPILERLDKLAGIS